MTTAMAPEWLCADTGGPLSSPLENCLYGRPSLWALTDLSCSGQMFTVTEEDAKTGPCKVYTTSAEDPRICLGRSDGSISVYRDGPPQRDVPREVAVLRGHTKPVYCLDTTKNFSNQPRLASG
jgi:hypothetical protein